MKEAAALIFSLRNIDQIAGGDLHISVLGIGAASHSKTGSPGYIPTI